MSRAAQAPKSDQTPCSFTLIWLETILLLLGWVWVSQHINKGVNLVPTSQWPSRPDQDPK